MSQISLKQIKKNRAWKKPGNVEFPGFCVVSKSRLTLAEFPHLFGDRQTLPKTPGKTEMVLRFPLGFV